VESIVQRSRTAAGSGPRKRTGRRPAGQRSASARPDSVAYPDPAHVPDWSPETLALLEDLTPLQRAFIEWYVSGCSAAEAYRKASGRDPGPSARNNGAQLLNKPHVRTAVAAAMRDRNVGARYDREWLLQKLYAVVCRCERSDRIGDMNVLIAAIRTMARIQGELQPLSRRRAIPRTQPVIVTAAQRGCRERIEEILRDADACAATRRATATASPTEVKSAGTAVVGEVASLPAPVTTCPPATTGAGSPPTRPAPNSDIELAVAEDFGEGSPTFVSNTLGAWITPYRRMAPGGGFMGVRG